MIKRLRFVSRRAELSVAAFATAWPRAVALATDAPLPVRPLRVVACTTLHGIAGTAVPHDGLSSEWFTDVAALQRFEAWLAEHGGRAAAYAEAVFVPDTAGVVVAEEHVVRGADWLTRRWAESSVKCKHMALAQRAHDLSPEAFSQRWRNRPGVVGAAGSLLALTIPERARGHAYVQNHPLRTGPTEARYDAINEAYFDDLGEMAHRIEFFRQHEVGRADADLVSEATFIAVEEHVIADVMRTRGAEP